MKTLNVGTLLYPQRRFVAAVLATALLAPVVGAQLPQALAVAPCPMDVDVCLVVNSASDTDLRDDVLTLREALRMAQGTLAPDELSPDEWGQVIITMPPGWGPTKASLAPNMPPGFGGPGGIGNVAVLFDQTVFCADCPDRDVVLDPAAPTSSPEVSVLSETGHRPILPVLTTPPGAAAAPTGWQLRVGQPFGTSSASKPIVIDGSHIGAGDTGLAIMAPGVSLHGLELRSFPGPALALSCAAADNLILDEVKFTGNGTDIATPSCLATEP